MSINNDFFRSTSFLEKVLGYFTRGDAFNMGGSDYAPSSKALSTNGRKFKSNQRRELSVSRRRKMKAGAR